MIINNYNKLTKTRLTILGLSSVLITLCLSSCSLDYTDEPVRYAKVYDRSHKNSKNKSAQKERRWHHVVEQGESLYSIARRYNRDFREIAAINNVGEPYNIVPGQKIFLDRKTYKTLENTRNQASTENDTHSSSTDTAYKNYKKEQNQYVAPGDWIWPTRGNVATRFNSKSLFNNGIDIVVKTTTPVVASAAGKVVYQGAGLKGYGKLIIIKHSDEYLSAYAHNDWLLVNEGQWVTQGQKIAYIGQQYEKKLHFQIRKNGKPVDPLRYLPN